MDGESTDCTMNPSIHHATDCLYGLGESKHRGSRRDVRLKPTCCYRGYNHLDNSFGEASCIVLFLYWSLDIKRSPHSKTEELICPRQNVNFAVYE